MAQIPLTQGQVAIVDDADFEWFNQWKWQARWDKNARSFYATRTNRTNGQITALMHREIVGAMRGQQVDHRNGNTLDNRRTNLRISSHAQNQHNQGKYSNNTSGFKGVSWYKATNKWTAKIRLSGKDRHLGYFTDPVLAAKFYDFAAVELHGEFACINFPRS